MNENSGNFVLVKDQPGSIIPSRNDFTRTFSRLALFSFGKVCQNQTCLPKKINRTTDKLG
jgi:hypothetical protein